MRFRHHFERLSIQLDPQEVWILKVIYLEGQASLSNLGRRADLPEAAELLPSLGTLVDFKLLESSMGAWY